MKVTKSGSRRAEAPRSAPQTVDVDDYLYRVPEPGRSMLKKMRAAIRSVVPRDATETINYRMPAFTRNGVLLWYAAFADHCSLFPAGAVVETFKNDLKDFKTSKGTIQFPLDKPLPIGLIKRIVRARVAQHEAKKRLRTAGVRKVPRI
jgi:uncharacterized protein YdhG (YjbR/CyaY superfamily)